MIHNINQPPAEHKKKLQAAYVRGKHRYISSEEESSSYDERELEDFLNQDFTVPSEASVHDSGEELSDSGADSSHSSALVGKIRQPVADAPSELDSAEELEEDDDGSKEPEETSKTSGKRRRSPSASSNSSTHKSKRTRTNTVSPGNSPIQNQLLSNRRSSGKSSLLILCGLKTTSFSGLKSSEPLQIKSSDESKY